MMLYLDELTNSTSGLTVAQRPPGCADDRTNRGFDPKWPVLTHHRLLMIELETSGILHFFAVMKPVGGAARARDGCGCCRWPRKRVRRVARMCRP